MYANLTRYDLEEIRGCGEYDHVMSEQADGEYVKFEDVVELLKQTNNNGSTPCRFFSRDKVFTGQSADGDNTYQSVPWCNHEPSQRAIP